MIYKDIVIEREQAEILQYTKNKKYNLYFQFRMQGICGFAYVRRTEKDAIYADLHINDSQARKLKLNVKELIPTIGYKMLDSKFGKTEKDFKLLSTELINVNLVLSSSDKTVPKIGENQSE